MKLNNELAYLAGAWIGDGSFYRTGNSLRVEITDGTSIKEELKYSEDFLNNLKRIIKNNFNKDTKLIKKGNQRIIRFRDKHFFNFLLHLGLSPGRKTYTCDIPDKIKGKKFERAFWIGVLDTDGMIGRNTKKITLTSASKNLCLSFSKFLNKLNIRNKFYEYSPTSSYYFLTPKAYVVQIDSPFIRDFAEVMCFNHPRKRKWLLNHLKKEFYIRNEINIKPLLDNNIINYSKIFDERIYIVDGYDLATKFELKVSKRYNTNNIPFVELLKSINNKKIDRVLFYKKISNYRIKMSKGSTNSITIPFKSSKKIKRLCKLVRLTCGGIKVPREFAMTTGYNTHVLIDDVKNIFDINPKFTSRGEIIFCSGVLNQIFSKFIKRKEFNYKKNYWLNKWSNIL